MLSVAEIPMAGRHFTGIIGVVLLKGKEYRVATYLGARAVWLRNQSVRVSQGDMELEACLLDADGRPLKAPCQGNMVRTIHESAACHVYYRFRKKGNTILEFETKQASFEYEYQL